MKAKPSKPGEAKRWSRKQRKAVLRQLRSGQELELEVVHPQAAGIDIGNNAHYVAVRPDVDAEPVRCFGCFTVDLEALADWLQSCGVTTVAMQSTGVYWIPLYEILQARGFEVYLVNARHTKNLPGRKSDVQECQWMLKLHTYGLLSNSFQPTAEIRTLRTYWRQRDEHVRGASTCIQRMQKALTQMNVQLANVISDLSGVSGQKIVRAIADGECNLEKLAAFCDPRIQASREEVIKSLQGNWQKDLLFVLKQEIQMYDTYQQRIAECDRELENQLKSLAPKIPTPPSAMPPCGKTKKPKGNAPKFDLRSELQRVAGADLTQIDGVDVMTAQTVVSEAGLDMGRWKTEGHFVSWIGLCPDNRVSGGKILGQGRRNGAKRLRNALRVAATTLLRSNTYLGAQYRRFRTKLGAPKAITAMAHKLARLIYRMLKYGYTYVDKGVQYYETRYRNQQVKFLQKKAAQLGFQVIPA